MAITVKKRLLANTKTAEVKEKEKMPSGNGITELVFILDRSGSMSGLEGDTIGGFNSMIREQKEKDGKCYVSTVLFNDHSKVIHDRVSLEDIPDMTANDYRTSGCTALIDALGDSIHHMANIHKYARREDVPEHTMFVITTDGYENASRRYSADEVRRMIKKEKEKYGWEFIFIGANIDAVETARRYGINEEKAINYVSDQKGTSAVYRSVSKAVMQARFCQEPSDAWRKDIEEDNESRG